MTARWFRSTVCALLGLVLVGPLTDPATAQARTKPDLVVASVTAPATAQAGAKVTLRVSVRNTANARAVATTTSFALSKDKQVGRDRGLRPTLRTPVLRPRKSWSGRAIATIPANLAPGRYFVVACADSTRKVRERKEGNNCRVSAAVAVAVPDSDTATSDELIEADVAAGVISEEQGLIYRVFSSFRDPRLPKKYVGVPDGLTHGALADAATGWDDLTPTGQDTLRPFLIPPHYAGSHWSPASGGSGRAAADDEPLVNAPWCVGIGGVGPLFESWNHLDAADGAFRIWWLEENDATDSALAEDMALVLEHVLPKLEALMGHSYKPDTGGPCSGGSPAVDISLIEAETAEVIPDNPACGAAGTSTHVVWPRTKPVDWAGIHPYIAHEVMHTIQLGMPVAGVCNDYIWLREMTAEWVQDYVTDPIYGIGLAPDDTEHLAAPRFLNSPKTSLDAPTPASHAYGAYLLAQWGARRSSPAFIKDIWTNAATMKATEAVDAALPGDGFESTWDEFALSNWNRGPVHDYKDWDDLQLGAKTIGPETVFPGHPSNPTIHVEHLAAQYLELDLDAGVTELEITNDLHGDDYAKLRAVVTYDDGNEEIVNLSDQEKTVICIDDGARRVTSIVLIFSNAHQTDATDFKPTLKGFAYCGCPNAPAGATTGLAPRATAPQPAAAGVCTGNVTFSWTREKYEYNPPELPLENEVQESGSGSLGLAFLPDEDGVYQMDPASTYSIATQWHGEDHRPCGDTFDKTHQGEGTVGDLATAAWIDEESGELQVNDLIGMRTTWESVHTNCGGTWTDTGTDVLLVPDCPVMKDGGSWAWEFEPTAPGSKTYTFECDDTVTYGEGTDQVETIHVKISGTVTLP